MILAKKWSKKVYYGWVIVFLSGLIFFFSGPGQTYSISVFIDTMPDSFKVSQTVVGGIYSLATVASGFTLIFMGKWIDRFGPRKMVLIVATGLIIVLIYNSFAATFLMFGISFFFLRFFGQGSLTLIPSSLVPQWFEKKRAFALSLAQTGGLLSTLIVPALNVYLIQTYSWEMAWRIWALALGVFFIPLIYFALVNKPEDLGLLIEDSTHQPASVIAEANRLNQLNSTTLKEALRHRNFWVLGFISTLPSMFSTGLTFYFYSIMRMRSVPETQAAILIGLIAIPAFFMPMVARVLFEKGSLKFILLTTVIGIILSMALLLVAVNGFTLALMFMIFYGGVIAVMQLALNVAWPNYFGRFYLGSIRGAATVFMVIGSALGPLPFGISYDLTGDYQAVIIGMMIYTGLVYLFSLTLKNK